MQIRLRAKTLIGPLVFACAHAFFAIGATPSVIAQQFPQTDLEDLKAADLIELYKLQKELGSPEELDVWESMFDELVRWWAAEHGLDANAAVSQLSRAYEQEFGQPNASLMRRVRKQLVDLPSSGISLYQAPSYIPTGSAYRVRRPAVIGRPPFGPIEKNGITRLSTRPRP
ncbi:MAG: hypothetical protein H8E44_35490 [Planctomycetes bacterium]|nr:hypothetical protein [Planctomycetota bacterium]MBL7038920.1 hypothetical protein [Pirellulaceae bacterium]